VAFISRSLDLFLALPDRFNFLLQGLQIIFRLRQRRPLLVDFALIGKVEQAPVAGVEKLAVFNFRKVTLTYSDL
jgi:hypothetical protein